MGPLASVESINHHSKSKWRLALAFGKLSYILSTVTVLRG